MIAVLAELLAWAFGTPNHTETFAWFRVQAWLGPGGFVVAAVVGVVAAVLLPRRIPAWVGVTIGLLVHLAFQGMAQGHPDSASWLLLSQGVARDPGVLLHWSDFAWATEEARFHRPLPVVPASYGLAFAIFGESPRTGGAVMFAWEVLLLCAVAWAGGGPRSAARGGAGRSPGSSRC